MSSFDISVNDGGFSAELHFTDFDNFPTQNDILSKCEDMGITHGIDLDIANKSKDEISNPFVFAKCQKPQYETPIRFDWRVEFLELNKPIIDENDNADYKNLNQFINVEKGQALVSVNSPKVEKPGKDIFGKDIHSLPVNAFFQVGNNIEVSSDGLSLVSMINGCLFIKSGVMHIDDTYQIRGDVDFHTGNIDFDGDVIIGGDVKSGFSIVAKGSIYINGTVESANLTSKEGSIFIRNGIQGKSECIIKSNRSIFTSYVQNANIKSRECIFVQNYIMNSNVEAGVIIDISKGDGIIRASNLNASLLISNTVGSENSTSSTMVNIHRMNDSFHKLDLSPLSFFINGIKERLGVFSEIDGENIEILDQKVTFWNSSISSVSNLLSSQQERVIINKELFENVEFVFDEINYITDKKYNHVHIYSNNNSIILDEQ